MQISPASSVIDVRLLSTVAIDMTLLATERQLEASDRFSNQCTAPSRGGDYNDYGYQ